MRPVSRTYAAVTNTRVKVEEAWIAGIQDLPLWLISNCIAQVSPTRKRMPTNASPVKRGPFIQITPIQVRCIEPTRRLLMLSLVFNLAGSGSTAQVARKGELAASRVT